MAHKYNTISFGSKKGRITIVHLKKPDKNGLAGMVLSPLFTEPIALVIDNADCSAPDYEFGCLATGENGETPRICLEKDVFYDFKRGLPYARMILFHELGHFFNKDLVDINSEKYEESRLKATEIGKVLDMELNADTFAASCLGKNTVISGLAELKEIIAENYDNSENTNLAISEIDKRIHCLQLSDK